MTSAKRPRQVAVRVTGGVRCRSVCFSNPLTASKETRLTLAYARPRLSTPQPRKNEAAFLFIQWMTSKDLASKILLRGIPSARVSAWKDPRFQAEMKQKDWVEASVKSMEAADPVYSPPVVAVSEVQGELGAVIVSLILGENVKAAADEAYAEIVKIMAKTEGK